MVHFLTSLEKDQDLDEELKTTAGWPDGRRTFGTVSSAIIDALADGQEMSVKAIRVSVEQKLGGRVSRFSVSDYLLTRSKGSQPLFERTRYGYYRLSRSPVDCGQFGFAALDPTDRRRARALPVRP